MVTAAAAKISSTGRTDALALLGLLVYGRYGISLPAIEKTPAGKPYFPDRRDIFFSLSHTKTHVLAAVSDDEIGVDVETRRDIKPALASRVCTEAELAQFDFLDLWVLKESYVKLLGMTFADIFDCRFALLGDTIIAPDGESVCRLYGDIPGCRAAIISRSGELPESIPVLNL
jgi:hypothetical protein